MNRRFWVRQGLIVVFYTVLTLLMTLPVILGLNDFVVGTGGDPWQTLWRFEHKLLQVEEVGWGDFIKHEWLGGGEDRLVNLSVWPWMGIHLLFGQPLTYNLIWLLSFMLAGYGMYVLMRYLFKEDAASGLQDTKDLDVNDTVALTWRRSLSAEAPALLAGVMYMFLPFHVAHGRGHFGALQVQWLPWLMLAFLAWVKRPNWWKTVVLAVLFMVQAWSEHHYALWFSIFVLLYGLMGWSVVRALWRDGRRRWVLLLTALVLLLVVLPYSPTIRLASSGDSLNLGRSQVERFSADLFSFVAPSSDHPIWGSLSHTLFGQHFTANIAEAIHFLGLLPLLLVLFMRESIPKQQWRLWVMVGLVFFVMSLGPRLTVIGYTTVVPLPYALIDSWPVFSSVRAIGRASVMVGLSLAILFGWVLRHHVRRPVSIMVLFGLLLLEFLFIPVQLQSAELPRVYERLLDSSGSGVLEIPAATNYRSASRALYGSLVHEKEVIGNIALERALGAAAFEEPRSLPVVRQLLYLRTTHLLENRDEFFSQDLLESFADAIVWLDVRDVVIHQDSVSEQQLRALQSFLEGEAGLTGETVGDTIHYSLTSFADQRIGDGVFLARDGGFENVGYDPKRASTFAEISSEAHVTLYNVRDAAMRVQLSWQVPDESQGSLRVSNVTDENEHLHSIMDSQDLEFTVEPGATRLRFTHEGVGRSIIQNPQMTVINPAESSVH